ncbi:hypothetical protein QZH56_19950 [Streptomyces olivoreticuli]|uniref:hypothetical protein n=1 Tax=Streptomyces olivoreticuli TaxID=68246 RepID=UPI00265922E3|nr:hypothetical protein [Streptomyces olivoreticuli]WKK21143.1 hypothetical protein QZH56_19950 [Streptomyces olivoreticuli]
MTAVHQTTLPKWLCLGARVVDTSTDREGIVHGIGQPYSYEEMPSCVWLLPPGGGFEWSTEIPSVQPIDAEK